ncbi:MAG: type IV pilus secretin PilQ [candidate division NC10 bacterium]|nr:type IV pilus secretin PilQ [candidate division NC10 bacterium]
MQQRGSSRLLWSGPLLGIAVFVLGGCATEMAEVESPQPAPMTATPAAPWAPQPSPPTTAEPPRAEAAPPPAAPPPAVEAAPAAPAPAPAEPALPKPIEVTGVDVQEAGPGGLAVVVAADGPITTYESFTLPDPPRLILDIPNATHAIPQPIPARPPMVTAVRSSQYRERPAKIVRLVVDLRSMLPYQVATAENQLRVQLGTAAGPPAPAPPVPAPVTAPAPPPAAAPAPVGKVMRVDLQSVRGRQRIVIGTSGRVAYSVSEISDPPSLVVDVSGAQIDPAGARPLDLRQVASPLSRLQAIQHQTAPDPVVRVVADLRAPTRYEVQQTPSAILVELLPSAPAPAAQAAAAPPPADPVVPAAPVPAAAPAPTPPTAPPPAAAAPPAPPVGPPGPTGRLYMDFKDADINNLPRIIAVVSGMNVVAGGDVTGKVTVRLVNVDWQQALDVILKINGMGYELDGNIIRVAPLAKLAAEQKAREDTRVAAARAKEAEQRTQVQLEPLVTEVVEINYATAADVVKNLDRLKTPGRPDASIAVDDRTNKLIIKETKGTIAEMKKLLQALDRATPQVMIEARIVEATRSFSQSLGVEYAFTTNALTSRGTAGHNLTPISVFTSAAATGIFPTAGSNPPIAISFPASGVGVSGIGLNFGTLANNFLLGARLSAAENENKIRTLSAPKVATLDNQEAEIRQGTQVPYTTVDSSGRTVVAFQDAFIRLRVTPHITNDRRVSMKVEAERSFAGDRIDFAGGFAFKLEQRKASTNILVSNGSTVVIGGLMQNTDSVSETGLPWLKNVPVLGLLFKSHSIGPNDKIELLIFLTPTILEEPRLG